MIGQFGYLLLDRRLKGDAFLKDGANISKVKPSK